MMVFRAHKVTLGVFLAVILAFRALVPAGWMPSEAKGQWITICSGAGVTVAWLDADGKLHKESAPAEASDGHCTFAALGFALDVPPFIDGLPRYADLSSIAPIRPFSVAVGQGLAAPPPPKTGPPALS